MNYPNPRHLQAFVAIVQAGSMAKAAEQLHMGQPALSQAIANLESLAGLKLFSRAARTLRPTPAGMAFYRDAVRVIEENQRLLRNIQHWADAEQGSVCVMSIPSVAQLLLPAAVQSFSQNHPHVSIEVHDLPDRQLTFHIQAGEGDLSILTGGYEEKDSFALPLLQDHLRWLASAGHPLSRRRQIGLRELAEDQLILLREGSVFRRMAEPILRKIHPKRKIIEVDQLSTLISMVSTGMGVSLIPGLCCPGGASPPVISRPLNPDRYYRIVQLCRPRGRELMPSPAKFMHFFVAHLQHMKADLPPGVSLIKPTHSQIRLFEGKS